jgi:hypothetical protein
MADRVDRCALWDTCSLADAQTEPSIGTLCEPRIGDLRGDAFWAPAAPNLLREYEPDTNR